MWNSDLQLPGFDLLPSGLFELNRDFEYVFPWKDDVIKHWVVVPEGYRTNFASIPWFFRWLISPIDKHIVVAAVVHDYLVREFGGATSPVLMGSVYGVQGAPMSVDWNTAAWIFRRIMREQGAPAWKRGIAYTGVRIYGWWNGR